MQQVLFREPDGRRKGLLFSLFSVVSILGWVYFGILLDGPHIMLFLGIGFAFSGVAESLPRNRRRVAAVLRILGLGILVVLIVLLTVVPESILG